MTLKIWAAEGLNRRVYYDFYGVHSKSTPEHERAWKEENQARTLCTFLSFHFPQLPQILRHYKPWHKKRRQEVQSHVFNPFIHKLRQTQKAVWAAVPLSPAVTWLSVRYLGCRLGAAGRFRCCNQTPLIPPRLITRLKFCTNWPASHTTAKGPCPPGNPWRQMRA